MEKHIRIYWLLSALIGAVYVCGAEATKPNVLLFISDDQYLDSVGAYGKADGATTTPIIDAFAKTALRFDRAFVPTAMCAPSRGAIYSGRYPHSNGLHANHWYLKKDVKTLPDYLNKAGYLTILAGKGHVKTKSKKYYKWGMKIDRKVSIPEYSNDDRPTFDDAAIEKALKGALKKKQPFFITVSSYIPHAPAIPEYAGEKRYRASNRYVDHEFGRSLQILKNLGIEDETVVIYLSDHGANLPFSKWMAYDRGVHIPLLVRWPGLTKPGTTDALTSTVDLVPTLMNAAGVSLPGELDGKSLIPVLRNPQMKHHDFVYFAHTSMHINGVKTPFPIRGLTDGTYKYLSNLAPGRHPKAPKVSDRVQPAEELYHRFDDAAEENNLAKTAGHEERLQSYRNALDTWMKQQEDTGLAGETKIPPRQAR